MYFFKTMATITRLTIDRTPSGLWVVLKHPHHLHVVQLLSPLPALSDEQLRVCREIVTPGPVFHCICLAAPGEDALLRTMAAAVDIALGLAPDETDPQRLLTFLAGVAPPHRPFTAATSDKRDPAIRGVACVGGWYAVVDAGNDCSTDIGDAISA